MDVSFWKIEKWGGGHFVRFYLNINWFVESKDKPTLRHIKALELDWLCIVDHGWEVWVDVGGGTYIGVLSYESLLRFFLLLSTLHRNGDLCENWTVCDICFLFFLNRNSGLIKLLLLQCTFLLLSWSDASEISVASVASDISVTSSSGTWKHKH